MGTFRLVAAITLAACSVACADPPAPQVPTEATIIPGPPPEETDAAEPSTDAGESAPAQSVAPRFAAIVAAPDRLPEDRMLDAGRKPAELLSFYDIRAGMKVAELGAGGGYTAELLARAVGPTGVVYGHNTQLILERFAEKPWSARLERPVMSQVKRIDREFDDPLPSDVRDLDAVFVVLFYHDLYWMNVDRSAMNRAVLRALKPGGIYAIVDHSGAAGTGATQVQTLHRIEQATLRADIERAGFVFDGAASFLENPDDQRDWNAAPGAAGDQRGTSDRFVLRFKKPR